MSAPLFPATAAALCACQWGRTMHCRNGQHQACRSAEVAGPRPETYLAYADGTCVMAPGPVLVWPAGQPCRWACPCDCHTSAPARTTPAAAPAPAVTESGEPVQVALF